MKRRTFVKSAISMMTVAATRPTLWAALQAGSGTTLKDEAARKGIIYGSAATQGALSKDRAYADLFVRECAMLVTEREFRWDVIQPEQDRYDFKLADWQHDFAMKNGLKFRGHSLAGNGELPQWAKSLNPRSAPAVLLDHIKTIVSRYAGRVHSWTVINEAIAVWDKRPDGLRKTAWLSAIGPNYIDDAFYAAAQADPKAMLIYNDNKLDYDTPEDNDKEQYVIKLLGKLKHAGVPIHALGIQGHLKDTQNLNPRKMRDFLSRVADLGLNIMITEFDVTDHDMPTDVAQRDRMVADMYSRYLDTALQEKVVIAINTWGLSDKYTWLSAYAPREDGTGVRPLPFDSNLQPKPARSAIIQAFRNAPAR